jgi:uncharacterized membrane-anchored protein YhcB (DUF1043 family)
MSWRYRRRSKPTEAVKASTKASVGSAKRPAQSLRIPLGLLSHAWAGSLAWLLVLLATLVVFALAQLLGLRGDKVWFPALAHHLAIAGIVGAVLLRYLYEQHRERQRELAESDARLQALQARIRPHFLFNSMNTIASLTRVDAALAEEVVEDLSDLFRASLSDAGARSTLAREIELARGYLRIEQHRLGDRLRVSWDLQELARQRAIAGLAAAAAARECRVPRHRAGHGGRQHRGRRPFPRRRGEPGRAQHAAAGCGGAATHR